MKCLKADFQKIYNLPNTTPEERIIRNRQHVKILLKEAELLHEHQKNETAIASLEHAYTLQTEVCKDFCPQEEWDKLNKLSIQKRIILNTPETQAYLKREYDQQTKRCKDFSPQAERLELLIINLKIIRIRTESSSPTDPIIKKIYEDYLNSLNNYINELNIDPSDELYPQKEITWLQGIIDSYSSSENNVQKNSGINSCSSTCFSPNKKAALALLEQERNAVLASEDSANKKQKTN